MKIRVQDLPADLRLENVDDVRRVIEHTDWGSAPVCLGCIYVIDAGVVDWFTNEEWAAQARLVISAYDVLRGFHRQRLFDQYWRERFSQSWFEWGMDVLSERWKERSWRESRQGVYLCLEPRQALVLIKRICDLEQPASASHWQVFDGLRSS